MLMRIEKRQIGEAQPPYIIAELSANHNGQLDRALESIQVAKKCGADAVKIQTYTADTMTIDCDKEDFQIHGGLWDGYKLYDLYREAHTPYEWHKPLFDHAKKMGITLFSTPFDEKAVDMLEELQTPAYKIASFEITDLPLIKYVAQTKKPMIMSTGMANFQEIQEAVDAARANGCENLVLLHCISSYPAPVEESHLKTMTDLARHCCSMVGLSDHTLGTTVATASVALGACVIEKHFTLSRKDKGPDSEFSLEPHELERLCKETKSAWLALGNVNYHLKPAEKANIKYRRSIYAVQDIKQGEVFTTQNIRRIRPGFGLSPKHYDQIIGKKVSLDIERGSPIKWDMFE